jgi:hypothetical protein
MNFKIATSLLLLAFSASGSFALRGLQDGADASARSGSGFSGGGGGGGGGGPDGSGGPSATGRPFAGGPDGDRPGFPGQTEKTEFTDITCIADSCSLRNGDEDGVFVCRQMFHPITGETRERVMCIPSDRAWESDTCGCCGDNDCPEQPDFVDITCDDAVDEDQIALSRAAVVPFDGDVEVVCRELTDPFIGGEPVRTTLYIPANRGLDGDTCGCCDDTCPEPGDMTFPRPDAVSITCETDVDLITCGLPSRKKDGEADEEEEGLFVCRKVFNPITGESEQHPVCVPSDRAWSTDECGCCEEVCPERPAPVEIECEAENDSCELRDGEAGVFVCRELFHPISGDIAERSLCIPSDRAWVTDTCSCCESGCPELPAGGFDSEDTQLVSLALEAEGLVGSEVEANGIENNTGGSGAGGALCSSGIMMMNIFVGMTAALLF